MTNANLADMIHKKLQEKGIEVSALRILRDLDISRPEESEPIEVYDVERIIIGYVWSPEFSNLGFTY
jgi:hypothetical protein